MKLLHIDSAITGEQSVSRKLSAEIVGHLKAGAPDLDVTYRDLVAAPFGHLMLGDMPAQGESTSVLDEFLAADIVVIGAPMYNFTVSSQLKAWIDRILIPGKTFRYGEAGPIGLAGDKRVIVALSRGGLYSEGAPARGHEHVETYLKTVLSFIGITPEFVIAEGMLLGPEQHATAIAQAERSIAALPPWQEH
ncbi:FMN-dependent NADH-azoreductase [Bosea sp. OAE752]|uniref:FMN-dependent NADH-azoreductase n=1 Tax=Bosea sp. OAE752 TaxID=2663873 RepID=UPI0011500F5E